MSDPPERFKKREDYSPAETVRAQSARRRGEVFRVETDDYKQHRAEALFKAGLDDEAGEAEKPLAELSAEQHFERKRLRGHRFGND